MTVLLQTKMPSVIIPQAATDVDLNWALDYADAEAITIQADSQMNEVLTFLGSTDGINFGTVLDLTATPVKGPTGGNLITYNGIFTGLTDLKLHLGAGAGAARVFSIIKVWRAL